jgi:hypothetical protein
VVGGSTTGASPQPWTTGRWGWKGRSWREDRGRKRRTGEAGARRRHDARRTKPTGWRACPFWIRLTILCSRSMVVSVSYNPFRREHDSY